MNKSKFTKGPWSIWTSHHEIADTGDYYDEVGVKDNNGRQICVMCGDWDDGIIEANVALIKTSPDMYAMLEELQQYFEEQEDVNAVARIMEVLLKARGEE